VNNPRGRDYGGIANMNEFITVYRSSFMTEIYPVLDENKEFPFSDEISGFEIRELRNRNTKFNDNNRPNLCYPFYVNLNAVDEN
jgi:adenine-specific DNA-methyltransferase